MSRPGVVAVTFPAHFVLKTVNQVDVSLDRRKDPLSLPHPVWVQQIIEVDLPEEWDIEKKPVVIQNAFFYYKKEITYIISTHKLTLNFQFKSKQEDVPPADYVAFKKDFQEVLNDLYYTLYYNKGIVQEVETSTWNAPTFGTFLLVAQLLIVLLIMIYRKAFFKPVTDEVPRLIGGLLVPALICLLTHGMAIIYSFISGDYFDKATWLLFTDEKSMAYLPGYDVIMFFEILMKEIFLFFSFFLLFLIVKNSHLVPKIAVTYIIVFIFYSLIDTVAVYMLIDKTTILTDAIRTIFSMAGGGIFIPFFHSSERSKETFIR